MANIRAWLEACNQDHNGHCLKSETDSAPAASWPVWLIAVREFCIKSASSKDRYVALSYVWGSPESHGKSLEALVSNIQELQQKDIFRSTFVSRHIPSTVLDAINFTNMIGEQYLWVDRLCIVQDDLKTKIVQISNMGSIYGSAYFTIVAVSGDHADYGLRGIEILSPVKRENMSGQTWSWDAYERHHDLLSSSIWYSRGWTLQELVFSKRAIFFHENTVTCECHCVIWHEGEELDNPTAGKCLNRLSEMSEGLHYSPWPDLEEYTRLVKDYGRRKLTSPKISFLHSAES
jgi:hypothetical protein